MTIVMVKLVDISQSTKVTGSQRWCQKTSLETQLTYFCCCVAFNYLLIYYIIQQSTGEDALRSDTPQSSSSSPQERPLTVSPQEPTLAVSPQECPLTVSPEDPTLTVSPSRSARGDQLRQLLWTGSPEEEAKNEVEYRPTQATDAQVQCVHQLRETQYITCQ